MFLEMNSSDIGPILAACLSGAIILFVFVVFTINVVKRVKKSKKIAPTNEVVKSELVEAFGSSNIKQVEMDMSRITVTVDNVELVNTDKVKELGASGILLVGNQVKCSFKDNVEVKYNELKGAISNE